MHDSPNTRSYMAVGLAPRTRVAVSGLVAFRRAVVMIVVVPQDVSGGYQRDCNSLQPTCRHQ